MNEVEVFGPDSEMYGLVKDSAEDAPRTSVDYDSLADGYNAALLESLIVFAVPEGTKDSSVRRMLCRRGLVFNTDYSLRRAKPLTFADIDGYRRLIIKKMTASRFRKPW